VTRTARLLTVAALLLVTGCGLPLPTGVQSAGQVQPQGEPAPVEVLPPPPEPGASPEQVLRGFLNAQSSPDDDHAVARQFLAPDVEWDDEAGAVVYELGSLRVQQDPADPTSLAVRVRSTGRIGADGTFSLRDELESRAYSVARQPDGEFRLVDVGDGLLLTTGERERSFEPYDVYFLGRSADGTAAARLVADRVFLPVTAELAPALVERLLTGASDGLAGAVANAAPAGTTAEVEVVDGVVQVDLSEQVLALETRERQRLAAQLVWTLMVPPFTGVRLLAGGEPFDVPGAGAVQDRDDWEEYDPLRGLVDQAVPLLYVRDGVVRSLAGPALPESEATSPGGLSVEEVAVSPAGGALALITRTAGGNDVLRVGPPDGPFTEVLAKGGLRSPTWGPGTEGVWLLEPGPRPLLWLVPGPGAPEGARPQAVPYSTPAGAGPLTTAQVSRDGARIALVFGSGAAGRLHVGRIEAAGGRFQVTGVEAVAPGLVAVTDVAWESGTSLVVLASRTGGDQPLLPWDLAVDGSTGPSPVLRPGLTGVPESLAAMPGQPLVVAVRLEGRSVLFRESGALLVRAEPGSVPVYPG
jgi:hypothetical protein